MCELTARYLRQKQWAVRLTGRPALFLFRILIFFLKVLNLCRELFNHRSTNMRMPLQLERPLARIELNLSGI